jgi:hypothetical protein
MQDEGECSRPKNVARLWPRWANGRVSLMPTSPDQWIVVGHIPALVTQDRFEQVQAKLKTNQQFARRNNRAHTYLLRALVSCGCCQLTCAGQTRRGYSYYTCVGKSHPSRSGREEKCGNRLIPMKQLDAVVWADLSDLRLASRSHPAGLRASTKWGVVATRTASATGRAAQGACESLPRDSTA